MIFCRWGAEYQAQTEGAEGGEGGEEEGDCGEGVEGDWVWGCLKPTHYIGDVVRKIGNLPI
jgi:hypothetical protein